MAPKLNCVYSRGSSNNVTLSNWLIIGSDDEHDQEYVPPNTRNPTHVTRPTRATPTRMAPDVVTASKSNEERILTEGASSSVKASGSEEAFGYVEASRSEKASASASSDEATSVDFTPAPQTGSPLQLLISPTGGVSRGSTKYMLMLRCPTTRGS